MNWRKLPLKVEEKKLRVRLRSHWTRGTGVYLRAKWNCTVLTLKFGHWLFTLEVLYACLVSLQHTQPTNQTFKFRLGATRNHNSWYRLSLAGRSTTSLMYRNKDYIVICPISPEHLRQHVSVIMSTLIGCPGFKSELFQLECQVSASSVTFVRWRYPVVLLTWKNCDAFGVNTAYKSYRSLIEEQPLTL